MISLVHGQPICKDSPEIYKTIDSTPLGDVQWESFCMSYTSEQPAEDVPAWMNDMYDIWFWDPKEVVHNMLAWPNFPDDMDYQPFQEYESATDKQQWEDFLSGGWAWKHVVCDNRIHMISHDPETHGSTFVPIILGSDKTTVSVVTSQNDYYPLYLSVGSIKNKVHHAHCSGVVLITFLTIPHTIILGPYIADYEEQVLLVSIVWGWCVKSLRCLVMQQELDSDALYQSHEHAEAIIEEFDLESLHSEYGIGGNIIPFTSSFPHVDIYELIALDILHQIIKGIFQDHLVEWVENYLKTVHSTAKANMILDDIDWRYVYLPAIEGHVPTEIVWMFYTLLEFTYLVCCNIITEETLAAIQDAIDCFHKCWEIFCQSGTIQTFSLPCQHPMKHYPDLIHSFGAPNGLCMSITELKHIDAVKEPYWQTNHNKPLGQMLVINQHLDKTMTEFAAELSLQDLPWIVNEFLFHQLRQPSLRHQHHPMTECPSYRNKITVINSATALFYVLSNISGIGGMQHEYICSCHSWQNGPPQYDCAFVNTNPGLEGMCGLDVMCILVTFFSFVSQGEHYPCTVVWWFDHLLLTAHCFPVVAVIHVDTIYHAAHLIPLYATHPIPRNIKPHCHSYDIFATFYANRFINHHAFLLLSDPY
ncbi:hypothetical protein EDC04DRAFT_2871491 [Pisolithus marmoratus]|nr:hypothetical protein EDC04DRAFT_2871491 [Pisolithus marmoratus]